MGRIRGHFYVPVILLFLIDLCLPMALSSISSEALAATSPTIQKLTVLPSSFSPESKQNYPDWINHMQANGYGNAIWHELEDILYDSDQFELIMVPPTSSEAFRHILSARNAESNGATVSVDLPDLILTINVNFFVGSSESLHGLSHQKNNDFHATVHLRYYDLNGQAINRAIPATGDATDSDLIYATRLATRAAATKLLKRLERS